eukprot:6750738-Pyramimonas_sp.AAC.1
MSPTQTGVGFLVAERFHLLVEGHRRHRRWRGNWWPRARVGEVADASRQVRGIVDVQLYVVSWPFTLLVDAFDGCLE